MGYGHVKMSRKAYAEDPLWNQPRVFSRWEAWEDMIQLAAFRRYRRPVADGYVELERGEILASLRFLANRWKWGVKKVRGFTQWCLKEGRISTQRETQHGTVYLLVNYDSYQSTPSDEDTPKDTSRAHRGHTEGTPRAQVKKAVKQLSSKKSEAADAPTDDFADTMGLIREVWKPSREEQVTNGSILKALLKKGKLSPEFEAAVRGLPLILPDSRRPSMKWLYAKGCATDMFKKSVDAHYEREKGPVRKREDGGQGPQHISDVLDQIGVTR